MRAPAGKRPPPSRRLRFRWEGGVQKATRVWTAMMSTWAL